MRSLHHQTPLSMLHIRFVRIVPRAAGNWPTWLRQTGARAIPSWLPAPTQGFVELDQREQFIPFGLCQAELGAEEIAVRIQRIEQGIDAAPVAHVG